MRSRKRGQSVLEYTIILAAIIAAVIAGSMIIKGKIDGSNTKMGEIIETATNDMDKLYTPK